MPPSVSPEAPSANGSGAGGSCSGSGGGEDSIRVAVRFRPLNSNERKQLHVPTGDEDDGVRGRAWRVVGPPSKRTVRLRNVESPVHGQSLFSYDDAFDETQTSAEVFESLCRGVVDGAAGGIDGTIFAYGQTGSGKTFTMQGPDGAAGSAAPDADEGADGIVQMAARRLFRNIESAGADKEFLVRTSFVEVYNEVVRDLLLDGGDGPDSAQLRVRDDPKRGGAQMNCREVIVTNFSSLMDTMASGELNRIVASTNMNARSSRSHAIFRITVESREAKPSGESCDSSDFCDDEEKDDRAVLVSSLNLVDLAGSESAKLTGATGQRQREGGKINQSLLTLSQVINSLSLPPSKRPKHINYRDSKLTRILQSSLSGNARMAVLCCASPSSLYVEETRSTLKFASRAKMVQTKAKKNEIMDDRALIRRLQKELAEAKRALAVAGEREKELLDLSVSSGREEASAGNEKDKKAVHFEQAAVDVTEERAKFNRLKSMILQGGGIFGAGPNESSLGGRGSERNLLSKSANPSRGRDTLFSMPVQQSMRDLRQPHQRPHHRFSVVAMQVAHHNDADVLMQIYEEDGTDEDEDGGVDGLEESPALLTAREGVGAARGQNPDFSSSVPVGTAPRKLSTSERDILRAALTAKSEMVRSLQVQLHTSQNEVQSLEERVLLLEENRRVACALEPLTNVNGQVFKEDDERMREEVKWLRFQLHTLMVVLSSLLLFIGAGKLGIVYH